MELIKYLIKRYPLMLIIILFVPFDFDLIVKIVLFLMGFVISFLEIIYLKNIFNDYIIMGFLLLSIFAFLYSLFLPIAFEYVLKNANSGFTYNLLLKLKYSKVMQIIWILLLVIICHIYFYITRFYITFPFLLFYIIFPFLLLFIYWDLFDIWKTLKDKENKNIIQKIVYIPLNGVSYICRFVQELNGKIKIHLKKLLFFKKYIAAVISKTQLLCFILVNVLCSGYVFIKLLDFCWFKIVKVYFMDIRGLFLISFSALWGVYQIVRFFILPNIYNFMLDNTKSGAVHSFIFSLKNTKWCKYLVLLFALIADILLAIYLYRPPFYFSYGLLETFDNFDIYITVFMLFISITPIYLILYLYWHVEKQNRLEKTENKLAD